MRHIDLLGQKFNRLTVISYSGIRLGNARWRCQCDCGNIKTVDAHKLKSGRTKSCGCLRKGVNWKHGLSASVQGGLLYRARFRAKKYGLPCTITLKDMTIPKLCPILGISLDKSNTRLLDNSPSLDRIVPELGYIPSNVRVISQRANVLKSNGTAKEHIAIAKYIVENSYHEQTNN